jgi:hypothetical protein
VNVLYLACQRIRRTAPLVVLFAMARKRPVRVERRLSAISAADVAGYSRLMHRDEEAIHAKLAAPLVAPYEGSDFCLSFATLTVFLHKIYAFDFTLAKTRLSLRRTGADGQSF